MTGTRGRPIEGSRGELRVRRKKTLERIINNHHVVRTGSPKTSRPRDQLIVSICNSPMLCHHLDDTRSLLRGQPSVRVPSCQLSTSEHVTKEKEQSTRIISVRLFHIRSFRTCKPGQYCLMEKDYSFGTTFSLCLRRTLAAKSFYIGLLLVWEPEVDAKFG